MKPVNAAILSYGMSGKLFHAPFLSVLDEFNFYAVWERSKKTAAEKYPEIISYSFLDDLLADENVELVVVNTPNATHFEYAAKALRAGKHVIVEKPFTVTVQEAEKLIAIAKENSKLLSVYHNRRFDSDYRTVKQVVDKNYLGEIVEAEFHFDRYKLDLSVKQHKETPGPGTGALYDLGSHIIDQALQLFGMPEAVFADIRILRPTSLVDDYFELLLYYPQRRVRLHASYLVREPLPAYILHGTNGSFIKAKTNMQEEALDAGMLPIGNDWGVEPESERGFLHTEYNNQLIKEHITSARGHYADYFTALFQAIRQGAPLPVTAAQGRDVIKVVEAAIASSAEQIVIQLS